MTLMEKEILEQPKVLASVKKNNADTIEKLVKAIEDKGDINLCYFAARGTSDHASIYAQYLIGKYVGVPSALATCSVITAYEGKLDLSNALVIGVSQSGCAADGLAVMERGKQCGAITVAVTNDESSPMAKAADFHLFCNAGEEKSVAATKTFTSQMYALALFIAKWAHNTELEKGLDKVPDAVGEFMETLPAELDKLVPLFRYMDEGFTLGRGYDYPIALESALKLQETNYVKMKGAAVSDFHHGPFAQVEEGTPVILYCNKGPVEKDAVEMLNKLDGVEAEVVLVTDDKELAATRKYAVVTPDLGNDALGVYCNAVFAQYFACKLTAVKGRNPDAPRGLKKVTITK
ncbi:MAG: SIS domain-containing protein [Firmicutes bacterium]|nr:SIS domain-containing protein [Bacillota bacterium]